MYRRSGSMLKKDGTVPSLCVVNQRVKIFWSYCLTDLCKSDNIVSSLAGD
jgi:hypothetical protein